MHPESELEEALLVAAYKKRQIIEVMKVKALVLAAINPDKAADAFMDYMETMLPEYAEMRVDKDKVMFNAFQKGMQNVFVLGGAEGGFSAREVRAEDA